MTSSYIPETGTSKESWPPAMSRWTAAAKKAAGPPWSTTWRPEPFGCLERTLLRLRLLTPRVPCRVANLISSGTTGQHSIARTRKPRSHSRNSLTPDRRYLEIVQRARRGPRRQRQGCSGRSGGAARPEWRGKNHHVLHDRWIDAARRRFGHARFAQHHRPSDVPAGPERYQLPSPGSFSLPEAHCGSQYPGDPRNASHLRQGAAQASGWPA